VTERRRTSQPRRASRARTGRSRARSAGANLSPEVIRSIVGIVFLVVGVITLIALLLPGEGRLTDLWLHAIAPWFGTWRWLLPFLLIGAGIYLERARSAAGRWQLALLGGLVAYLAFLGLVEAAALSSGGRIGRALGGLLIGLITKPGAVIALLAVTIAGVLVALDRSLPTLFEPLERAARTVVAALGAVTERDEEPLEPTARQAGPESLGHRVGGSLRGGSAGSQAGELPTPTPSAVPLSQTVWAGRPGAEGSALGGGPTGPPAAGPGTSGGTAPIGTWPGRSELAAELDEDETDQTQALHSIAWTLPGVDLLEDRPATIAGKGVDHEKNIGIIELKLRSFGIEAKVSAVNSGPVVTQYEVKPDANVKLSRIEGLADDLAMALAARSIRIEAPIPGKAVVGVEIPNVRSETVGFRSLIADTDMLAATSRLTFALGRDVSGQAYAVDLAKMPHLLVAGATGSGKSVCVNALITSLLMHARPWEVRLILVDLKRVELAPYDRLPHLLQHVIVETHEAKAALNWAVHEMEDRYKLLASRSVRNIAGYNAIPTLAEADRLPYIVLIIDELADLIMREGRKVEDPVVKIAQKARAVGIHLVLATQRPSVNVVTGLIKANVPSRIAFAMSSNVDSRTVLDQPGAEDLIGRGDMLYQPVDLPRPVRLQGVFVSDDEVGRVTAAWRSQTGSRTFYDESVFAFVDGEDGGNGGQFTWLAKLAEDDLVVRAAEQVTSSGRASTSSLQTKLKVGFSRASRLMDELERYGVIGPQDPRNPASPRMVYGPDNWLRSLDDVDDPGD
jgi:DNA segregation ATPase FtsK/SpoIIIE, S-DNA-T family